MFRSGIPTIEGQREPLGYEQITDLSSADGLTPPMGTRLVVLVCEAQAIRYRDDGTDPTATVGMPLAVNTEKIYTGRFTAIKFFEQVAGAKLNISYYR
jgi:hypothetical protein